MLKTWRSVLDTSILICMFLSPLIAYCENDCRYYFKQHNRSLDTDKVTMITRLGFMRQCTPHTATEAIGKKCTSRMRNKQLRIALFT